MKRVILASAVLAVVAGLPSMAAAQAIAIMPGQWDIAVTTESIQMEGMPPGATDSMRGKTIHIQHCITPAEASRGPQEMLKANKSCTFGKMTMIAGRVHAEISCAQPGGGMMSSISDSTYTPAGFISHGRTTMTGQMKMTSVATTVGKRVGACTK